MPSPLVVFRRPLAQPPSPSYPHYNNRDPDRAEASSADGSTGGSGGGGGDATCAVHCGADGSAAGAAAGACVEASAKSFSYVPVRRRQVEAAEQAAAAAAAPFAPAPQARVRYESVGQFAQKVELYRGGTSTVLKGVCLETGGRVIIKAYHKAKMHPKHFHKLQRELAAQRCLRGPYVAEIYGSFEDAACVYLVMEYCEGGDLFKTMLMHGGSLEEQWVCVEVRRGVGGW